MAGSPVVMDVLTHSSLTGLRALNEPTLVHPDAATTIFNLDDYRVLATQALSFGQRRIHIVSTAESGCPGCGVIGTRRHSGRRQRVRDIPVAGPVEFIWAKRRLFCDESLCPRKTFSESTIEVPARARTTSRLRSALVRAVIDSGRAATETATAHGVSLLLVQKALNMTATKLPNVDLLRPRMFGIDEHRFRSVRFFKDPVTSTWKRIEPWITTIVDLDTGRFLVLLTGETTRVWCGGMADQASLGVAARRSSHRDRPLSSISKGVEDVAAPHGRVRRSLLSHPTR